jgi:chromatin remodeling complex protein RSC6
MSSELVSPPELGLVSPELVSVEQLIVKPLSNLEKLDELIIQFESDMNLMKSRYDAMKCRQKQMKKLVQKMQNKATKTQNKPKANRKPCGFARPSLVSDDMCNFLKINHGSHVSRTEVTKSLIQYIKLHNLQNESNKRQILPDETLYKLFGDDSRKLELTYFTMQKFVNQHFPKATPSP